MQSLDQLKDLLANLNPEEREETLKIIQEFVDSGDSDSFKDLLNTDYDEIPVDIRTFCLDKRYLGNSWDEKNTIYPFWLDTFENIFNKGARYNECLTGDTLIPLLDGTEDTLKSICDRVGSGEKLWVYTFNQRTHKPEPGLVKVGKCLGKQPILKITLNTGQIIKCTLDHRFLMLNNRYVPTSLIKADQSFMPTGKSVYVYYIEQDGEDFVYDIEVPGNHNFALSCGVYSSNCIFTGSIGIGKTTCAVIGFSYVLYQLMCLKNPNQYYGLPPKDTITFSMFNVTLDLVETVAYAEFRKHIRMSPWFNERGTWVGRDNTAKYKPNKNIVITIGSKDNHTLGQHVFCVEGTTLVKCVGQDGKDKFIPIKDVKNEFIYVYNEYKQKQELQSLQANSILTKYTNEVCEITLEDGTVIRLDPEHKILLTDGTYKRAVDIGQGDDILDVK